jgi:hypothetical protein
MLAAVQRAAMPDFTRWQSMVYAMGGCAQPIRLHGERHTLDSRTGEVLDVYRTAGEPTGFLLAACGNRRASRCPACSAVYKSVTPASAALRTRGSASSRASAHCCLAGSP